MTPSEATAPKLYELNEEYLQLAGEHLALVEELESAGGEVSDEDLARLHSIEERLQAILSQSQDKILAIARLCSQREVEIARLKAEEERIKIFADSAATRRKRLEKSNEFFETYCLRAMRLQGLQEISDGVNTLKIRSSRRVEVVAVGRVPARYIRGVKLGFDACLGIEKRKELLASIEKLKPAGLRAERTVDKVSAGKVLKIEQIEGLELVETERLVYS